MARAYRISSIGPSLPRRWRYGATRIAASCGDGFEVYIGPVYSIADAIRSASATMGS